MNKQTQMLTENIGFESVLYAADRSSDPTKFPSQLEMNYLFKQIGKDKTWLITTCGGGVWGSHKPDACLLTGAEAHDWAVQEQKKIG